MTPRTLEAAERGLPNSCSGVTVVHDGDVVGMGRVVGDGATVFQLSDIAVHPDRQGRGLGTDITAALVDWLHENSPSSAYVILMADVDGFYERFGFEPTAPASKGTYLRIERRRWSALAAEPSPSQRMPRFNWPGDNFEL